MLAQQVRRMLADRRATRFMNDFVGAVAGGPEHPVAEPDVELFPAFDDSLRKAMVRETELFFESQVREDRPVQELLRANYTFLNERLARHYGIEEHLRQPLPPGDARPTSAPRPARPRQRPDDDVVRGSHLGRAARQVGAGEHARCAAATAAAQRPAAQGERRAGAKPTSLRERMEQHRNNPVCASCHARMDPLGFALEHFDAIGQWRDNDRGAAINSTITLSGADDRQPEGVPRGAADGRRRRVRPHRRPRSC